MLVHRFQIFILFVILVFASSNIFSEEIAVTPAVSQIDVAKSSIEAALATQDPNQVVRPPVRPLQKKDIEAGCASNTAHAQSGAGGCILSNGIVYGVGESTLDPLYNDNWTDYKVAWRRCHFKTTGGFTNWRLPTQEELQYAVAHNAAIGFDPYLYYWTGIQTQVLVENKSYSLPDKHTGSTSSLSHGSKQSYVMATEHQVNSFNRVASDRNYNSNSVSDRSRYSEKKIDYSRHGYHESSKEGASAYTANQVNESERYRQDSGYQENYRHYPVAVSVPYTDNTVVSYSDTNRVLNATYETIVKSVKLIRLSTGKDHLAKQKSQLPNATGTLTSQQISETTKFHDIYGSDPGARTYSYISKSELGWETQVVDPRDYVGYQTPNEVNDLKKQIGLMCVRDQ